MQKRTYCNKICDKKSYCTLVQNQWMKLVNLSFSNTHTIYKKKGQNFPKFPIISKFPKLSRILCNKTITTLELDRYEVLWSRVQQYWTRLCLVQYYCTLLHKTSYWSRSSAVIVYYYIVINIFLLISMENDPAIYPCICTLSIKCIFH